MARFISFNHLFCDRVEEVIMNTEHIVHMMPIDKGQYRLYSITGGQFILTEDEYNRVKQLLLGKDRYENR